MCQIMQKLKGIKSKPVSSSFDNYEKIPGVLNEISKILQENNNVVISRYNRQRIIKSIRSLNIKRKRKEMSKVKENNLSKEELKELIDMFERHYSALAPDSKDWGISEFISECELLGIEIPKEVVSTVKRLFLSHKNRKYNEYKSTQKSITEE